MRKSAALLLSWLLLAGGLFADAGEVRSTGGLGSAGESRRDGDDSGDSAAVSSCGQAGGCAAVDESRVKRPTLRVDAALLSRLPARVRDEAGSPVSDRPVVSGRFRDAAHDVLRI